MRVFLSVLSMAGLFVGFQSEAKMLVNEKVIMSKENAKDVECSAFSFGIMSGAKEEVLSCVSKHLKKGYSINEEKTTSDIKKLKADLAKFKEAEEQDQD